MGHRTDLDFCNLEIIFLNNLILSYLLACQLKERERRKEIVNKWSCEYWYEHKMSTFCMLFSYHSMKITRK